MDIIMNYIDSMFAGVPVNEQTKRLREDITANMCDKYDELIKEGKSGNEAIGTVISEFGNIDEVLTEMGISRESPLPVQTEDPAALHKNRIRLFGALSGVGAGWLLLGTALVSPFAINGSFTFGTEFFGLCFAVAGILMLIISLLVRTKILVSAGSIPDGTLPFLRAAYSKGLTRHFRMKMVFGGVQIAFFLIFVISDLWNAYSVTGTIFMLIAVSLAFAVSVHCACVERMYGRVLGEMPERPDARAVVSSLSVPFFAFAVTFSKFNAHWGSTDNSVGVMWALAVLFMAACVGTEMYEAVRKSIEQHSGAAVTADK